MEILAGSGLLFLIIALSAIAYAASRFRRCPSNKVIVVYGKVGNNGNARCISGGGVFVVGTLAALMFVSFLIPSFVSQQSRGSTRQQII